MYFVFTVFYDIIHKFLYMGFDGKHSVVPLKSLKKLFLWYYFLR